MSKLSDAVFRTEPQWSQFELARRTGLAPRTVRELLYLDFPLRQFRRPTLAKLDKALGWKPGTAWRLYSHREFPSPSELVPVPEATDQDALADLMDDIAAAFLRYAIRLRKGR